MGQIVRLSAEDGHSFDGYLAKPEAHSKGGLVVIQEIFGVNAHIRAVCDRFTRAGFTTLAPALFDRVTPGTDLGYEADDVQKGLAIRNQIELDQALQDIKAAGDYLKGEDTVSVVGYCWGGTLAYLTACRLSGFSKAVGYYGGMIAKYMDEQPQIPTLLHFGGQDTSIPLQDVDAIMTARRETEIHLYQAGHGFNCDLRADYDAPSARLALERSLTFISER